MNPKMKITLVDLLSYNQSHTSINTFWTQVVSARASTTLVAEKVHADFISTKVSEISTITFRKGRLWRIYREFLFTFFLAKHQKDQTLIVLGATGVQQVILAMFEHLFPRKAETVLVIFHSELEGLNGAPGIQKQLCRFAIRVLGYPHRVKAVILGEHIKDALATLGVRRDFKVINHPLPKVVYKSELPPFGETFETSVIGLIRGDIKNLDVPKQLSKCENVSVRFVGRKGKGYTEKPGISTTLCSHHYDETWMRDQLKSTHGLLVCPHADHYRLTASGAATDSILYGKFLVYLDHVALRRYDESPFAIHGKTISELAEKIGVANKTSNAAVNEWIETQNYLCERAFLKLLGLNGQ